MTIDDISDASHGARVQIFLESMTGKTGMSKDLTMAEIEMVDRMATAEMLDEIHCMLRELLKK
jgi:hypothetical protein